MRVDTVAAMQGAIDAKEKHCINSELARAVQSKMNAVSVPNSVGRRVFHLSDLLKELSEINFDEFDGYEVAKLFELIGQSIGSGLVIASYED